MFAGAILERIPAHAETCHYCDLVVDVPEVLEGSGYRCPRCGSTLSYLVHSPVPGAILGAISSIILFFCVEFLPFMKISVAGIAMEMSIREVSISVFSDAYKVLALFVYFCMQIFPLMCLLLICVMYASFATGAGKWAKRAAKMFFSIREWCMIEVFLVATLVSMVKLVSMTDMTLKPGFYCFCLFIFIYIRTMSSVDRSYVWGKILKNRNALKYAYLSGKHAVQVGIKGCECCETIVSEEEDFCPGCGKRVETRKPDSVQRCLALVVAAVIMYLPANLMPIMITETVGQTSPATIIDGVIYMWSSGSYFVSMIIFIASVFVPALKIGILLMLCWSIKKGGSGDLGQKTKLYHLTEFIGKWSMVDVFVVVIMTAYIRMGTLMSIYPGTAAVAFCSVVVLTMLAANSLDSRDLWNNADTTEGKAVSTSIKKAGK